jgi:hypothetical protein
MSSDDASRDGDAAATPPRARKARAAVGQMTATADIDANFNVCAKLAKEAAAAGCAILMVGLALFTCCYLQSKHRLMTPGWTT